MKLLKTKSQFNRFLSPALIALLVIGGFTASAWTKGERIIYTIRNAYLRVDVDSDTGNFTIFTVGGDPDNPLDDNLAITDPDDSFIALRIYFGGQKFDFALRGSGFIENVGYGLNLVEMVNENQIRVRWLVFVNSFDPTFVVERELTLVGDMVEVRVRLTGVSNSAALVGVGIVLDPGFNAVNSPTTDTTGPFFVPFHLPIDSEREFHKETQLPPYWVYTEFVDIGAIGRSLKGIIVPSEGLQPDRVVFALAPNLQIAGFGFDYPPDPFTHIDAINVDSAVGIYWNRFSVVRGSSQEVITHIGTNRSFSDYRRPYSLIGLPVPSLNVQIGDNPFTPETEVAFVTPNPFPVTVSVYNSSEMPVTDVSVSLSLPSGFSLAAGEPVTKLLETVGPFSEQRVTWQVRMSSETVGRHEFLVSSFAMPGGARQVKLPVLVPFLPVMNLPAGFNLIGFPFDFDNPEPSTALGIPREELKLAHYDPSLKTYLIYGRDAKLNRIELGKGYWLRLSTDQTITLQRPRVSSTERPILVTIKKGWNQLSNPFPWPALLSGMQITVGSFTQPFLFEKAINLGFVRRHLFLWRIDPNLPPFNGEYVIVSGREIILQPWQGFWLFSEVDGNAIFSAPQFIGTLQTRQAHQTNEQHLDLPDGWAIQIVAQSNSGKDSTTWLCVSRYAKDSLDQFDMPKPPALINGLQVSSVLSSERGQSLLSIDARSPQRKISWTLQVSNPIGNEVQLQIKSLNKLPNQISLLLVDLDTGQKWSLRNFNAIRIQTSPDRPKRLQLIAFNQPTIPLQVRNLKATRMRRRGVNIQFAVTMPAYLKVQVRSLTGRLIWETQTQSTNAGARSVFWDGRQQNGQILPSGGIYVVVVQAQTDDGRLSQAQTIIRW